jgi:Lysozyme inhibitor LprI
MTLSSLSTRQGWIITCLLSIPSFFILCGIVHAAEKPPDSILGTYSASHEACFVARNDEGMECEGFVNDVIAIKPGAKGAVSVSIYLLFFNGHECNFGGKGTWRNNLLVARDEDCTVMLRFRDNAVMTMAGEECRMLCGARGSLDGAKLYKLKGLKGEEPPKPVIEVLNETLNALWDENDELNRTYRRAYNSRDKAQQMELRDEQRKWIAARDKQCRSALPKSGTEEWLRHVADNDDMARCVLEATRKRTKELSRP